MEGKSILIVDDSERVREELRTEYIRLGLKVVGECVDGVEAIEFLEENPNTEIVSLDIIMPEMDGIECYRKIRTLGLSARVIIVSALASEPRFIHAFENEIKSSHFVAKDVMEDELEDSLAQVLADEPVPLPKVEIEKEEAN